MELSPSTDSRLDTSLAYYWETAVVLVFPVAFFVFLAILVPAAVFVFLFFLLLVACLHEDNFDVELTAAELIDVAKINQTFSRQFYFN